MAKKPTEVETLKIQLDGVLESRNYWQERCNEANEKISQLTDSVNRLEKQVDDKKWLEAEYVAEQKRAEHWRGVALGMDPGKAMLIERGPDDLGVWEPDV